MPEVTSSESTLNQVENHSRMILTPKMLVTMWNEERPWEEKTEPTTGRLAKITKLLRRTPQTSPRVVANQDHYFGSIKVDKDGQDIRAWILGKLGKQPDEIKGISPLDAQALIAEGLGISRFQAAILDHATRGFPPDTLGDHIKHALEHPKEYAQKSTEGDDIFALAEQIEELTKKDWYEMSQFPPSKWETSNLYQEYKRLKGYTNITDSVWYTAITDVIEGERKDKYGKESTDEFLSALAVLITQGNKKKIATTEKSNDTFRLQTTNGLNLEDQEVNDLFKDIITADKTNVANVLSDEDYSRLKISREERAKKGNVGFFIDPSLLLRDYSVEESCKNWMRRMASLSGQTD